MIAVQLQTVKEPVIRDTRDTWELREALLKEKDLQLQLLNEINSNEEKISKYETERSKSKEQVLRDTLQELKAEAGLTEIKGIGIKLHIKPIAASLLTEQPPSIVSPELLKKLVNELNMYGAKHIAIDNQRYINSTVIRDINTITKMNGHALSKMPIEIKVIVDDMETAEKLYNRMKVSKSADEFYIDNLQLTVSKAEMEIIIPAYQDPIIIRYMEAVDSSEGGRT